MTGNKDSRTDNWAGYRDYNSSHYHKFPRSAREAGFYYAPDKKETSVWPILIVLFIFAVSCYWFG